MFPRISKKVLHILGGLSTAIFTLLLVMNMFHPSHMEVFLDVEPSDPYAAALEYLEFKDVLHGVNDGDYVQPHTLMTRAELFTVMARLSGGILEDQQGCFSDVLGKWFEAAACTMKSRGFLSNSDEARPDEYVTLPEAAKLVSLVYGLPVRHGENWFAGFVNTLADRRAIPMSIESFDQYLSRGEIAEMIYRIEAAYDEHIEADWTTQTYDGIKTFPSIPGM